MEMTRVLVLYEICEIQRSKCLLEILEIFLKQPKAWAADALEEMGSSA